jgi:hypothetical protein
MGRFAIRPFEIHNLHRHQFPGEEPIRRQYGWIGTQRNAFSAFLILGISFAAGFEMNTGTVSVAMGNRHQCRGAF